MESGKCSCGVITNFAHWNGEDHFLCDKCVEKRRHEQIIMEQIRRKRL